MFGAKRQAKYAAWRVKGYPQVVEYSQLLLDEILNLIADEQASFPQGGLEVGGLLFGVGDKHLVRILETRPVTCEHAFGPQFLLSEGDHERLAAQIVEAANHPDLAELKAVGWYVARSRGELVLRESDRQTHQRHFREPWQTVLVFRPVGQAKTRLGLYVKDRDGRFPEKPSLTVGDLGTKPKRPREPEKPETVDPEETKTTAVEEIPFRFSAEAGAEKEKRPSRKWPWVAAVLALILTAAWVTVYKLAPPEYRQAAMLYAAAAADHWQVVQGYWRSPAPVVATSPFLLRVSDSGDQLEIRWDGTAEALRGAGEAVLVISDGEEVTTIALSGEQLTAGSAAYDRKSTSVAVSLEAAGMGLPLVTETVRWVGKVPPPEQPEDAVPAAMPSLDQLRAEVLRLEAAIRVEQRDTNSMLGAMETLRSMAASQPPAPVETAAAAPAPASPPPTLTQKAPAGQPPKVVLEQRGAAVRRSTPPAQSASRAPRGAARGMLIWTGLLDTGKTLRIEGNRPSSGSLSGALPGVPVTIRAYPAELARSGLTVLSSDQQHSSGTVTEEPGPGNSWNRVTYRYEANRESGLQIVEMPSETNDWSRMSLQPYGKPVSMVVIRWERVN